MIDNIDKMESGNTAGPDWRDLLYNKTKSDFNISQTYQAYLVAIKCGDGIQKRIILAPDVPTIDTIVKRTFKNIDWYEVNCNYGIPIC